MPPLAAGWSFLLDVDGTLLDHVADPRAVRAGPELRALLQSLLAATGGAVALISGRSIADIDRLFAPLRLPVAGQHGIERRSADGTVYRQSPSLEHLVQAAAELVRLTASHEGLVLENKGMTLALHYRAAPALGELAGREIRRIVASLGEEFELLEGKFVYEIKPSGKDKGVAIAEFVAEAPFAGRLPVFIGDDLTDEHGFDLVNRIGGHSIKVGGGDTVARWRVADSAAVRHALRQYVVRFGNACEAGAQA